MIAKCTIEQTILNMGLLEVVHEDMALLSKTDQTQFAMIRRSGLGASDSGVVLGINPWTTLADLISEKRSIGLTDKEIEIGQKESVRRGRDVEPIILDKFEEWSKLHVIKPKPMYRIKEHPQLTINFDGIVDMGGVLIPVEAKCISPFGNKYWDLTRSIDNLGSGSPYNYYAPKIEEIIEVESKMYGIPSYYFTQIQQQMLGLNAGFGYLAILLDKGWDFRVYKVYKDEIVQRELIVRSEATWEKIKGEH